MKYGVALPIWRLSVKDAEALTLKAEELGLDGVLIPDHILAPPATTKNYGPNWPDHFVLLAYLAARTSRIQLGTTASILPYRSPLVAAKAGATVDQVSGGRFIFAVGVGWDEEEFRDLGIPFAERGQIADEYLRIIKTVWTNDVPSFQGKYFTFSDASFAPRPLQQPHPPIWVSGSVYMLTRVSVRRAAALGDAWHPYHLSLDDLEKGAAIMRREADKLGRRDGPGLAPRNLLDISDAPKGEGRTDFQGSPEEVAADIRRAMSIGADYIVWDVFSRPDVPSMMQLMERFVKEVKPAVG